MNLFPYQEEGAAFLARVKRGLLADDMGLGKSAQAIAACDMLCARDRCVLVLCPASLVENWKREFKRFSTRGVTPIVTSYNRADTLRTTAPPGDCWDVLILDEAHYLKTRTAKRTQDVFGPKCDGAGGLVERARHVFCLTGTPTPNNPSELWPMLRAVMPETITGANGKSLAYWPFVERYCVTRDNGFGVQILKGKNLDHLKAAIAPFVLRRKKDQVLKDLPPIRFAELALEGKLTLTADEQGMAQEIAKALAKDGVKGLAKVAPHVASLRRATGLAKVESAVEWIQQALDGGMKKLVVFAHHREVIDRLAGEFADYQPCVLTGSTRDRQAEIDGFQNGASHLFIGQIQAAGAGITLTAASDVLFVESSWVPAENGQAAMRVHRVGQRNACLIRFAMLAESLDEEIQRAVMRKTADIAKLFG